MSVMICVSKYGKIAMAADSLWASGYDKLNRAEPKIRRYGDTLVSVGPCDGYSTAMQRAIVDFIGDYGDEWPDAWPEHCLTAPANSVMKQVEAADSNSFFLVVWNGRMFRVSAGGSIFETSSTAIAVGCGGDYALGAANAIYHSVETAEQVAREAVRVACNLSIGCAPPIICEVVDAAKW